MKGLTGEPLVFCQAVLSRVPETLTTINAGLRTLHFYQLSYSPFDPNLIVAGAQDNGSWEIGDTQGSGTNGPDPLPNTIGEPSTKCRTDAVRSNDGDNGNDNHTTSQNQVWVQINIADGGQNNFDIGDLVLQAECLAVGPVDGGLHAEEPAGHELDRRHASSGRTATRRRPRS